MSSIGTHCILELYGCPRTVLGDHQDILAAIRSATERAGATLLHEVSHAFHPHGVTALGLLAESHISIHTWPELRYAACDVFTCGDGTMPERACLYLAEILGAERYSLKRLPRGEGSGATTSVSRVGRAEPSDPGRTVGTPGVA